MGKTLFAHAVAYYPFSTSPILKTTEQVSAPHYISSPPVNNQFLRRPSRRIGNPFAHADKIISPCGIHTE
jgi:hypothetical protein